MTCNVLRFKDSAEPIQLRSMESVNNNRWNANDNVQRANASAKIDQALRERGQNVPKIPCHKWGSRDNVYLTIK